MEKTSRDTSGDIGQETIGLMDLLYTTSMAETGVVSPADETIRKAESKMAPRIEKRTKQWKLNSLRAPFLTMIALWCGILIIVLEWLSWKNKDNGFIYYTNEKDFSTEVSFCYLYLPTMLAICLSLLWSWIDLDVKRLEPFYQLSKDQGALAQQSTLLQYPVDFIAFVPFKAAKYR